MVIADLTTDFARVTLSSIPAGSEHRRKDCPDYQIWLVTQGTWREGLRPLDPAHVHVFKPYERSHRIAETDLRAFGIQIFGNRFPSTVNLSSELVWKILIKG